MPLAPELGDFIRSGNVDVDTEIKHLAYGKKTWVGVHAVRQGVASYSLNNGISWIQTSLPRVGEWSGVAFGDVSGGTFAAVSSDGDGNQVATSTDGINWVARTTPSCEVACHWRAIAYGNGVFVAVGSGAGGSHAFMVSTDGGTTWQLSGTEFRGSYQAIAFGQGMFVAVGDSGLTLTSHNFYLWDERQETDPNQGPFTGIAYGLGKFVAIGANKMAMSASVSVSPDSTPRLDPWTYRCVKRDCETHATIGDSRFKSIAFGDGYFVTINPAHLVWFSQDGISWNTKKPFMPWRILNIELYLGDEGWPSAVGFGVGTFIISTTMTIDVLTKHIESHTYRSFTRPPWERDYPL